MSEKPYIRDPKGVRGGKFGANNQDQEDFEQEQKILEWLDSEGRSEQFGSFAINRKGMARNTIDQRSVRLDAQVSDEDGSRTYADIIAGSDGRDLERGSEPDPPQPNFEEEMDHDLHALGLTGEQIAWTKRTLEKSSRILSIRKLRLLMKEEEPFKISPINLESPKPWGNFKK